MKRILIIEDDLDIAQLEQDYLQMAGFEAEICSDGRSGLTRALSGEFDLILLDLMLPGIDGMEVCRTLRSSVDIPIIMVTARTTDSDKIEGLTLGADDYVEKPFSPSVLVARVKSHLERYERLKGSAGDAIEVGRVCVDPEKRTATVDGQPVNLRAKEFELLLLFAHNPNKAFTREEIYEHIWGLDSEGDLSTVTVHIHRLRDKVDTDKTKPKLIQTVRGMGYRLVP